MLTVYKGEEYAVCQAFHQIWIRKMVVIGQHNHQAWNNLVMLKDTEYTIDYVIDHFEELLMEAML